MVWQDVFPNVGPKLDAEHERELRLVEQARAGADWALAALIARYQSPVTRYLTRLTGSPPKARTLAEHVFIRMERRLHGPQGGRQLRLWLLRACTEAGLEVLRGPQEAKGLRLIESRQPVGLLPGGSSSAANFLRAGLGKLATMTGSTSRQMRNLIWANVPQSAVWPSRVDGRYDSTRAEPSAYNVEDEALHPDEDESETLDPHEALRHRMVRAVLAELPYGDSQCLALHLVAGLNQAEVALALGITASATRRRIVHGLTLFAQRYEAAAASLGLSHTFFESQSEQTAHDGARLDTAERSMPMVEALADDVEVDPLMTNEHIAVQPFAHDEATMIWSGRIHDEMSSEAEDATTDVPVEPEPVIVETSLAHVGEPMEISEPVAALPPPPNIPLVVANLRVHAEEHELADRSALPSSPLGLEQIIPPVSILDGEVQEAAGDGTPSAVVKDHTNDATATLNMESGNAADLISRIDARLVPILTESRVLDVAEKDATASRYTGEHVEYAEGESVLPRAARVEVERNTRVVPVLTAGQNLRAVASENAAEARVVPVLTSSPSRDQVALAQVTPHREDAAGEIT